MASTFKGQLAFRIEGQEVVSDGPLKGSNKRALELLLDLPNGTSDGEIDLAYSAKVADIGASVTTVYDLAGSVTDLSGDTITFAEVTTIAIRNLSSTAANYLTIGPDATNGFGVVASNQGFWADASDRNVIPANYDSQTGDSGWVILHCRSGVAVAAGSTDEIAVDTQSGTSANTWELVIFGRGSA
jgi:hypothetical protein